MWPVSSFFTGPIRWIVLAFSSFRNRVHSLDGQKVNFEFLTPLYDIFVFSGLVTASFLCILCKGELTLSTGASRKTDILEYGKILGVPECSMSQVL